MYNPIGLTRRLRSFVLVVVLVPRMLASSAEADEKRHLELLRSALKSRFVSPAISTR